MKKVLIIMALCAVLAVPVVAEEHHKTEARLPYVGVEYHPGYQEVYVAQPLSNRWQIHGLLYRTETENEEHHGRKFDSVGFIAPTFKLLETKGFEFSAGAGLYAGKHQPTSTTMIAEASYESKVLKGEGVLVQAFRQPSEHGHRDRYFVWYLGPQFKCWAHSTCEAGFAQDDIGHNRERENLRGVRFAAPLGIPHTKGFVKFLTHSTVLWGVEFRP